MTNEEIYDQESARFGYGPRCSVSFGEGTFGHHAFGATKSTATKLIETIRARYPRIPEIHFDLSLCSAPNAFAFEAKGRYFIGITTGLPLLLYLIVMRMLASRDLFPRIGNPEDEISGLPPLPAWAAIDADAIADITEELIVPRNLQRRTYAELLISLALRFSLAHELAHVILGHVDYLKWKHLPIISEFAWLNDDITPIDKWEHQVLEWQADIRAIMAVLGRIQRIHAHVTQQQPALDTRFASPVLAITDFGLAINILFRKFGGEIYAPKDLILTSHPPSPLRRMAAMVQARELIRLGWPNVSDDVAYSALKESMHYADIAFARTVSTARESGLVEAFGLVSFDHVQKLVAYWAATLREKLVPHEYEHVSDTQSNPPIDLGW